MLRSRLMIGVALLALLGVLAGCAADLEPPPEATSTLEQTVEETIVVSEQTAGEADVDLEETTAETETLTLTGYVTVDAYRYDAATGTYVLFYHHEGSNLITTIGLDWIAQQLGGTPSTTPAQYISLSTDTTAPVVGWSQLEAAEVPTEITTGGLARATGTYAHTGGTNEWTISYTFTATAAHTDVQLTGLQWSATGGSDNNLMAANTFTAVSLAIDDSLTITWTLTLP